MDATNPMYQKVYTILQHIRPYLQADGGDINLIEVSDDMEVTVELLGACSSCPHKTQTMYAGVERTLKKYIPEIKGVKDKNSTLTS